MNRLEKKESIEQIKALVEDHSASIIVHYKGLTVAQVNLLRGHLRGADAKMKVIKNSLAKLAIANSNNKEIDSLLSGPTALVVSNDPVSIAKSLTKFAKENDSLILLGGVVDKQFVDKKAIVMLSDMPSKDELRGKIIGLISAPASKLV
ncbi:MAG: 50S ribosomal protein L10, partial [Pseudomonadota bacterium]